jgi:serine phosphatase RsbU (regulator of sigma subunit)
MDDAHRRAVASANSDPTESGARTAARHRAAVLVFVAAITAAATACVLLAARRGSTDFPPALLAFIALAAVADLREIKLPLVGIVTLSFVPVLASLMVFGLRQAIVVATISGASAVWFTRDPRKVLFNIANYIVSTFLGGTLYLAMLPETPRFVDKIIPAFAYAAVDFIANTALLAGVISLENGQNAVRFWTGNYRWAWAGYLTGASLGLFLAWLYTVLGLPGLLLGVPPLYIIYYSYDVYVVRARERESHSAEVAGFRQELLASAQLHDELRAAQLKVAAEIERARRIQLDLLPSAAPVVDGLEVDSRIGFLGEMGGDYYDFVSYADGRLAVVCGDVMGKGLGAALLMAMARSVLHDAAETGGTPADVLCQVNDALARDLEGQHLSYFLTLAYALWDPRTLTLDLAGGGHTPVLLIGDGGVTQVASQGPMLGIRQGVGFTAERLPTKPRDLLAFYTDGITEARRPDGEQFGVDRLATTLQQCRTDKLPAILEAIWNRVDEFRSGEPPSDDVTLLLARVV